jgi:hypothetical protein
MVCFLITPPRAGCDALPEDQRAGDADEPRLRQGVWLVAEKA